VKKNCRYLLKAGGTKEGRFLFKRNLPAKTRVRYSVARSVKKSNLNLGLLVNQKRGPDTIRRSAQLDPNMSSEVRSISFQCRHAAS